MKKCFVFIIPALLLAFFAGCEHKPDPVEIGELVEHYDEGSGFALKYPGNWHAVPYPTYFSVFSSKEAVGRFREYDTKGFPGARISVQAVPFIGKDDKRLTLDDILASMKKFNAQIYTNPETIMIDGTEGKMITYSFDLEGGKFNGAIYLAAKDTSLVTTIVFESFDDTWDMYKPKFDDILASVKLAEAAKPRIDTVLKEADPPSATLKMASGDGWAIQIPENFNRESSRAQNVLSSANYIGERRADCNIQVDVIDASKQTDLAKIVEETRVNYKNAPAKETTLGGVKAKVLNWNPSPQVKSKVFFAVKDEKLYRVTINWFVGEEMDYLPIFEKSVSTFKFQ